MRNLVIVGLGLIGASLAAALEGFEDFKIIGVDIDPQTLDFARENGICSEVTGDCRSAVAKGDVVICCLYPEGTLNFLKEYAGVFKAGALVTDVCGVKTAVMEASKELPAGVDFVGGHPMAGREKRGIHASGKGLFKGAHYIITPKDGNSPENVALIRSMAMHIGCRDITVTTPERHDDIIAYTSQVMHIMAVSIVDDPILFDCLGFEGGSFRDCTRVAALDVGLWKQLFMMNSKPLCESIKNLEENLRSYRETIERGDMKRLEEKLTISAGRKRHMDVEHRRGDDPYYYNGKKK